MLSLSVYFSRWKLFLSVKEVFVASAPWFAIKSEGIKFLWKMCCLNFKSEINSSEHEDNKQIHLKILLFLLNSRKGWSGPSSPSRHGVDSEKMFCCLLTWDCALSSEGKHGLLLWGIEDSLFLFSMNHIYGDDFPPKQPQSIHWIPLLSELNFSSEETGEHWWHVRYPEHFHRADLCWTTCVLESRDKRIYSQIASLVGHV